MLPTKIRNNFPCLQRKRNGKFPIYFDNACMTLKPKQVRDAMDEYYDNFPACGGHERSAHWFAKEVGEKIHLARKIMQEFINAKREEEIIWTRNTTEGLNLVANSFPLKRGDIVLTTDREHNSNLLPWQVLAKRKGIIHKIVKSNEDNTFNIENFKKLLGKNVKLVSMVHTSNLDGVTIPIAEIIKICHENKVKVLIDGAQSTPHKKIDVQKLGVDFFAFSVHKMVGPTGVGVLYGKEEELKNLSTFLVGGDTVADTFYNRESAWLEPPYKFEAGLQNYAGQIGAGASAKYLMNIGMEQISLHEKQLNKYITENLLKYKEVKIIGPESPELRSGIFSFRLVKNGKDIISPSEIAQILDENLNIMIRAGSHCVHSWFNDKGIGVSGSARASLYLYNTKKECDVFIDGIKKIIEGNR